MLKHLLKQSSISYPLICKGIHTVYNFEGSVLPEELEKKTKDVVFKLTSVYPTERERNHEWLIFLFFLKIVSGYGTRTY